MRAEMLASKLPVPVLGTILACMCRHTVSFPVASHPRAAFPHGMRSIVSKQALSRPLRTKNSKATMTAANGDMDIPRFAPDASCTLMQPGTAHDLAAYGSAIVFVPQALANLTVVRDSRALGKLWIGDKESPLAPYSDVLVRTALARNRPEVNPEQELNGCFLSVDLPNERATRIVLVAVKDDLSMFEALELAGKAAKDAMAVRPASMALVDGGLAEREARKVMEAGVAAVLAATGPMPDEMKGGPSGVHGLQDISVFASSLDGALLARVLATAEGTNLCRYLTASPANVLDKTSYRAWVKHMAKEMGWRVTELDEEKMKTLGCGAFLAVSQASEPGAAIMRITYSPTQATTTTDSSPLVLVGKGITFDTGGVNVKGAGGMYGMKRDMSGSAAALGILTALTRMQFSRPAECWLAVADNAIGPRAYKPDDVVRAVDGTTIEIVHTDAEGRMVLADTLALASRKVPWRQGSRDAQVLAQEQAQEQGASTAPSASAQAGAGPGGARVASEGEGVDAADWLLAPGEEESSAVPCVLLDYATLTGACIGALSKRYAGVFSNRDDLAGTLIDVGRQSGERLWPFPMDQDFETALESKVADVLQCTVSSEADHILAAVFLNKFVHDQTSWIHFDLAPAVKPGGLGHVTTDETGFGVRASVALVLDHWDKVAKSSEVNQ